MPRFFIDKEDIKNEYIELKGENLHHIKNVLRKQKGDKITVSCEDGLDYFCEITEDFSLKICNTTKNISEPTVKITLFQGLPKGDKLSNIVEKNVEAGVTKIVPVLMKRSVSRPDFKDFEKKRERLKKVALSASKQCGRGVIPEVTSLITFDECINNFKDFDIVIFPYESENNLSLKQFIRNKDFKTVAVIIGPEGGFSEDEVLKLKKQNIIPVTLGNRILRTETAGLCAVFNILYETEN